MWARSGRSNEVWIMSTQTAPSRGLSPAVSTPRYVSAPELAAILGVAVKTVYRHKRELGAIQVGRAVRFDATARFASVGSQEAEQPVDTAHSSARRRASQPAHCQLLPVGRRSRPPKP